MKFIIHLSRIFAGLVFVFSGFVKAIDPTGFAIKFEEYFQAFNLDFLVIFALPLAIVLSAAELMTGLNLLIGVRMKVSAWLLLGFMTFFTVLTLILALTNPVTDCGCFGDAVKLTNWQTFGKNIILLLPTLIVFFNRKKYEAIASSFTEWYLTFVNFAIPVLLSVFCLLHQPLIDFRPYKTGIHIPTSMILPEDAPVDQYETILVYQKDGIQKEFSETNYPWQDSTWKWVETKQKLISKGMEPPIHDFSITTGQGEDITTRVLADSNYVFLIVAPKLESASEKGMQRMNLIAEKAISMNFEVYCLTSSSTEGTTRFINQVHPAFEIATTDETVLKTIIRANPGLLILREGTILGKWNYRDAPSTEKLQKNLLPVFIQDQRRNFEILSVLILGLIIGLFYCAFYLTFIPTGKR